MRAPYYVLIDNFGDQRTIDCQTLDEAIDVASHQTLHPAKRVMVCGEGAEGGYGDDGSGFWDGLTDDERDRCEEAGV